MARSTPKNSVTAIGVTAHSSDNETADNNNTDASSASSAVTADTNTSPPGSTLKHKIRIKGNRISSVLEVPKESSESTLGRRLIFSAPAGVGMSINCGKRSADNAELGDRDDADSSDISTLISRPSRKSTKSSKASKKVTSSKKQKLKANDVELVLSDNQTEENINHNYNSDSCDEADGADDETPTKNDSGDVEMTDKEINEDEQPKSKPNLTLWQPAMRRAQRIVNADDPESYVAIQHAIADGRSYDDVYFDSDEDLNDPPTNVGKPDLFRNVRWKDAAFDTETEPFETTEFTQFVPGRWERLPSGELRDQKEKLVIKLIDLNGNRRIFQNPPPKDWKNQEALTALNKRIVQQIRRNTDIRFRPQVIPYSQEERRWILANLNSESKPKKGWRRFVDEFNEQFEGKVIDGDARPARTHSSLTKEVERFREEYYSKGKIPQPIADKDKRKIGKEKRERKEAAAEKDVTKGVKGAKVTKTKKRSAM